MKLTFKPRLIKPIIKDSIKGHRKAHCYHWKEILTVKFNEGNLTLIIPLNYDKCHKMFIFLIKHGILFCS